MKMNNNTMITGGKLDVAKKNYQLPEDLTKIDVCFRRNEKNLHSIVFYSKDGSKLVVGISEEQDMKLINKQVKKGRVETFMIKDGEELIGCELHHSLEQTFGITWFTRKQLTNPFDQ